MDVLAPSLRCRPVADPPEREVLRRILPGLRHIPAHQIRQLPDDGAVWLWNSQPITGPPVAIGEVIDPERLREIPLGEPLRLVRIERELWIQSLEPDLEAPDSTQLPEDQFSQMIDTLTYCQLRRETASLLSLLSLCLVGSSSQKSLELVPWVRRWPAWRCWRGSTTCHFVAM